MNLKKPASGDGLIQEVEHDHTVLLALASLGCPASSLLRWELYVSAHKRGRGGHCGPATISGVGRWLHTQRRQ